MNILYVAWMHAGKILKKNSKFKDLAWKNLTKLACSMENFYKISMQHAKFLQNFRAKYYQHFSEFFVPIILLTTLPQLTIFTSWETSFALHLKFRGGEGGDGGNRKFVKQIITMTKFWLHVIFGNVHGKIYLLHGKTLKSFCCIVMLYVAWKIFVKVPCSSQNFMHKKLHTSKKTCKKCQKTYKNM